VVVVGGGISGLVAAYRLSQSGAEVTLVEPDQLGGKVQTSVFAGRPVDEGADNFLLRVPWALALCHDLELDGELVSPAERSAQVFLDGVRHPMPAGHVLGVPTDLDALAASGLVSPEGVARAARTSTCQPIPRTRRSPAATWPSARTCGGAWATRWSTT
jgi:protoporphyrinogen/coproporphyrinogen III oxidase